MRFFDWLDERTAYRALGRAAFEQELQGGARWAYVFGSGLAVVFLSQLVTGLVLSATYTPSTQGAWASVFALQHRATGGAFVRGLHHHGASAMMVVMGVHLLQVAVYGAYKRPREVNWWAGLALMALVCALSVTGYLLPWDQDAGATIAALGTLARETPWLGSLLADGLLGGAAGGQGTLTRVFTLHVGVLPGLVGVLLLGHYVLFRRHGPTAPAGANLSRKEPYFPAQVGRDLAFAVTVLVVLALVTARLGTPLGAPADRSIAHAPRPAGYFLWLCELWRLVPRKLEWLVTLGLPIVGGGLLFALPFFDRKPTTRVRERWSVVAPVVVAAMAILVLSVAALSADAGDPVFQAQRHAADARAARSIALARRGIPAGGPLEMLANDPLTGGPDLFAAHCARCHLLDLKGERWAPEHTGFGSRAWVRGLLHDPNEVRYFGLTRLKAMPSQDRLGDDSLRSVTEYLFSLGREPQDPPFDRALAARGARVFQTKCTTCHTLDGEGDYLAAGGSDLTGYASRTWLARRIAVGARLHGRASAMGGGLAELSTRDVRVLAAYLRLQRFEQPSTGPLVPPLTPAQRGALAAHQASARAAGR